MGSDAVDRDLDKDNHDHSYGSVFPWDSKAEGASSVANSRNVLILSSSLEGFHQHYPFSH